MTVRGPGRRSILWIALRDMAHDWRLSLVSVLGVAVVLAPLLILFGLKVGVVDRLRADLSSDPRNLELILVGGGAYAFDDAWFAALADRPETAFVSPMTRGTVAHMILRNRSARRAAEISVLPTGPGDPVLTRAGATIPEDELQIVLTEPAATRLEVEPGQTVRANISRLDGNETDLRRLTLTVADVLPLSVSQADAGYVLVSLITAIEDFREWQRVDRFEWNGSEPTDDPFADFRLYASGLDAVEPLRQHLVSQGLTIESAAARIERVRRIDRDLTILFQVILGLSIIGYTASLALGQLAAVERKRTSLAVLRLIGYRSRSLIMMPIIQGVTIALLGAAVAFAAFAAAQSVIGVLFHDVPGLDGDMMRMPLDIAGLAFVGSALLAGFSGLFAVRATLRISPAKELRSV